MLPGCEAMSHADVVVGNVDEFDMAVGARDPKAAAQAALDAGATLVNDVSASPALR